MPSSSGWKSVRSCVTSNHKSIKLSVLAHSLEITQAFFFAFNRNTFQQNTYSMFSYFLIILWTSFRQCLWISVEVHTPYMRFIEIARNSFRWLSRDARRHLEYFVQIFWRLKAKNRSLKNHWIISSESALMPSLRYLFSHLEQSDFTEFKWPSISFFLPPAKQYYDYGWRHAHLWSRFFLAFFFLEVWTSHIFVTGLSTNPVSALSSTFISSRSEQA